MQSPPRPIRSISRTPSLTPSPSLSPLSSSPPPLSLLSSAERRRRLQDQQVAEARASGRDGLEREEWSTGKKSAAAAAAAGPPGPQRHAQPSAEAARGAASVDALQQRKGAGNTGNPRERGRPPAKKRARIEPPLPELQRPYAAADGDRCRQQAMAHTRPGSCADSASNMGHDADPPPPRGTPSSSGRRKAITSSSSSRPSPRGIVLPQSPPTPSTVSSNPPVNPRAVLWLPPASPFSLLEEVSCVPSVLCILCASFRVCAKCLCGLVCRQAACTHTHTHTVSRTAR